MRTIFTIGLILLTVLLAACGQQETEVLQIGAITRTKYWVTEPLRWEGSGRHYQYAELCSPKLPKCLRGKDLRMSQFVSPTKGKLAVTFLEGTWSDPPEIRKAHSHFFDTVSGAEIKCGNCSFDKLSFGAGSWLRNGAVLRPAKYVESVTKPNTEKDYIVDFSETASVQTARQRFILKSVPQNYTGYLLSYSPALTTWATLKCSPECFIYWANEDLSGFYSKPTGCASEQLYIIWVDEDPQVVFSNWAQEKDICLDQSGKPMFRQLSHAQELALSLAQPGRTNVDRVDVYISQETK